MKNILIVLILTVTSTILTAQETRQDTLYIKYDENYLKTGSNLINDKNGYYLQNQPYRNGTFYLLKLCEELEIKQSDFEVKTLKNILSNKDFFTNLDNPQEINSYSLFVFFEKYKIFLVKDTTMIEVRAIHWIE